VNIQNKIKCIQSLNYPSSLPKNMLCYPNTSF